MNSLQVQVALAQQASELAERVARDGGHEREPQEFSQIRMRFPRIVKDLGITEFVERLSPPASMRATWLVELRDGGRGVLKLVGRPELSEAHALRAWRAAGVPCVEPLVGGMDGPVSVVLTRFIDAPLVKDVLRDRAIDDLAAHVAGAPRSADSLDASLSELLGALHNAHLDASVAAGVDHITTRIAPQLEWAIDLLATSGLSTHAGLFAASLELSAGPMSLIHGDPSGTNMLYQDGRVILFDGGFVGPAAYDAGQLIAEMVPAHRITSAIDLACSVDPTLRRGQVAAMVGITLTLHAAYTLARNEVPGELREIKGMYGDTTAGEVTARARAQSLLDSAESVFRQAGRPAISRPWALEVA